MGAAGAGVGALGAAGVTWGAVGALGGPVAGGGAVGGAAGATPGLAGAAAPGTMGTAALGSVGRGFPVLGSVFGVTGSVGLTVLLWTDSTGTWVTAGLPLGLPALSKFWVMNPVGFPAGLN